MRWPVAAVACLLTTLGCGERSESRPAGAGPVVSLTDSVVLSESEANFIAQLGGVAEDGGGRYLVTDMAQARVVRFSPSGAWQQVIGRKGAGPGEFIAPTRAIPLPGDQVLIGDDRLHRLTIFDVDGKVVRELPSPGIIRAVAEGGGSLWFGGVDHASATGIARWAGDSSYRRIFPFPGPYRASPPLAGIYTIVALDAWQDTVIAGYSGTNEIVVMDTAGHELDHFDLPVARRKGVTEEGLRKFSEPGTPFPDMFSALSGLFQLHRLSSGQVAAVHMDQLLDGNAIESVPFVSLISADRKRACVDGVIPLHGGGHPFTLFRGDTLLITEQEAQAEPVRTVIHRYLISAEGCAWVPIRSEAAARRAHVSLQARHWRAKQSGGPARPESD